MARYRLLPIAGGFGEFTYRLQRFAGAADGNYPESWDNASSIEYNSIGEGMDAARAIERQRLWVEKVKTMTPMEFEV